MVVRIIAFCTFGFLCCGLAGQRAKAGEAAYMMDAQTGRILAADNADDLNHPASLTKMMTLYLTFEALQSGRLKWNQKISVSFHAANQVPTKLGMRPGRSITVRQAVLGMIVVSGNDAAVAMAEKLAGSEKAFAKIMTDRARGLGMLKTVFTNASGLPDRRQVTTAREMSLLAIALLRDFPVEYKLFKQQTMRFNERTRYGHNWLLSKYDGVDGIKTGYTDWSGFNLVTSATLDNRRVVGVVMGGKSASDRDRRMVGLLDKYLPLASNTEGIGRLLQPRAGGSVHHSLRPVLRPGSDLARTLVSVSLRPSMRPDNNPAFFRTLTHSINQAVEAALQ